MLELDTVTKQYDRRGSVVHALRSTSLTIAAGEFVAVVGPSGSGKSTLLSMLGGMLAPTSGRVLLEGRDLYRLSVEERSLIRNRSIGFVFQQFNLVPWLTARENVQLPLCLDRVSPTEQRERADQLLSRVGLLDRADHHPTELSAGQQQRVALARTLINNPRLILADEPTGNLDPDSRTLVLQLLDTVHREGRTIVLVTHDPSVSAAARRILRIVDGNVEEQRSPQAIAAARLVSRQTDVA